MSPRCGATSPSADPARASGTLARGRRLARRAERWWPARCVVCHRPGADGVDLCAACRSWLPTLVGRRPGGGVETLCRRCGGRFAGALPDAVCRRCAARSSPFARLVAPWRYEFPLDGLIRSMKYRGERPLARVLGTLLARAARTGAGEAAPGLPECLVPVPSYAARRVRDGAGRGAPGGVRGGFFRDPDGSPGDDSDGGPLGALRRRVRGAPRERRRDFDHAAEIARWCARELGLAARADLAERCVDTGALAGLARAARHDRIRGAFRAGADVAGRHVAIVDDVLTSGATAAELARELYDTGAASVELWVLARTPADR